MTESLTSLEGGSQKKGDSQKIRIHLLSIMSIMSIPGCIMAIRQELKKLCDRGELCG